MENEMLCKCGHKNSEHVPLKPSGNGIKCEFFDSHYSENRYLFYATFCECHAFIRQGLDLGKNNPTTEELIEIKNEVLTYFKSHPAFIKDNRAN